MGQIEHADTALRDETKYKAFVEDVLSPCVVQLAIAVRVILRYCAVIQTDVV